MFTWIDYTILGIIIVSMIVSLFRGFVREILSLITWILAIWVAVLFYKDLANLLVNMIKSNEIRMIVSFVTIFIVTAVLGALVNYLIGSVIQRSVFSGIDRVLGVVFGVARGVLIAAVLMLCATYTIIPKSPAWQQSVGVKQLHPVVAWIDSLLPPDFAVKIPTATTTEQPAQTEPKTKVKP